MMDELIISTGFLQDPCFRNFWRNVGVHLRATISFVHSHSVDGYEIRYKERILRCPKTENTQSSTTRLIHYDNRDFFVLGVSEPQMKTVENTVILDTDIISPLIEMLYLMEERMDMRRDRCGLVLASNSNRTIQQLANDYYGDFLHLLSSVFQMDINSVYPYTVALTFDVDGFKDKQPENVIRFLSKWDIKRPTFMVMSFSDDEATIYDPKYNLDDPALDILWESDVEIGLHSSYLAHNHPEFLANQKKRLEAKINRPVVGHRSHYFRYQYPSSWGNQIKNHFEYDASLGYPDSPGFRNGTGLPFFIPDPDGFQNGLWVFSTFMLDQHLFQKGSIYQWDNTDHFIDQVFDRLKMNKGILTLDWHIHGYDPIHFPHHFTALGELLERAKQDGARVCGLGEIVSEIQQQWRPVFDKDLSWEVTVVQADQTGVSALEVETYRNVFRSSLGAASVDAATESLKSILPADAETILDIGSGPGAMAHRIPPFHRVLCMDIDELILASVNKPKAIGNITHIPLPDKKVELSMACDVLEHLTDEELQLAIKELERVSKKYIYIQTPYREILDAGFAKCNQCGYVWHINHHKQSFSLKRLFNMFSEDWLPKIVNFTGDISYLRIPEEVHATIKGLGISNVACVTCPNCSATVDQTDNDLVEMVNHMYRPDRESGLFPYYSEVGVLFEKNGNRWDPEEIAEHLQIHIETRNGKRVELESDHKILSNIIDFSQYYVKFKSYNPHIDIPYLLPHQVHVENQPNGILIYKSPLALNGNVAVSFPFRFRKGQVAKFKGEASQKTVLTITSVTFGQMEQVFGEYPIQGRFEIALPIMEALEDAHAFLRLRWQGEFPLFLSSVEIEQADAMPYFSYNMGRAREFSHLVASWKGIEFRMLLPCAESVFFSHKVHVWLIRHWNANHTMHNILREAWGQLQQTRNKYKQQEMELFNMKRLLNQSQTGEVAQSHASAEAYKHEIEQWKRYSTFLEMQVLINQHVEKKREQLTVFLERALVQQISKNNEREASNQKWRSMVSLFEQQLVAAEKVESKSKRRLKFPWKNYPGRILKKLINVAKRYPVLIAIGQKFGLRRVYHKLKNKGWI